MFRTYSNSSISTAAVSNTSGGNMSETVSYLQCYEAMVRHQDSEFDATSAHLRSILGRIKYLGRKGSSGGSSVASTSNANYNDKSKSSSVAKDDHPTEQEDWSASSGMLTYLEMRRCLLRLGHTWNRSIHNYNCRSQEQAAVSANDEHEKGTAQKYYYDDDVSIASINSAFSGTSGAVSNSGSIGLNSARDIIATDAQLIMLLTTLVEMEERNRAERLVASNDNSDMEDDDDDCQGLFLPEFVQAYKLIIGGMQSLQLIPDPEMLNEGLKEENDEFQARCRERTMRLLRIYGPNDKAYKNNDYQNIMFKGEAKNNGIPKTIMSPRRSNSASSPRKSRNKITSKDGLKPRQLNEENINKLVHSKDAALAKIMEENELEMTAIKTNMEELKYKERKSRHMLRKRRMRTRMAVLAVGVTVVGAGLRMEYLRREQVAREIALGNEVERKKNAETIVLLNEKKEFLLRKLGDAEGMARFEERRYKAVEEETENWKKEMEEVELKWWMDQGELERCRVASKKMDFDLALIIERKEGMEEEAVWCSSALERALKKSEALGAVSVLKRDGSEKRVVQSDETQPKNPVRLEMKYNKSFRNAIILRQAYSAVGGVAASILLRGLVPVVATWFAPKAVPVIVPTMRTITINSFWVDRISIATVAALVARTFAIFFLP